MAGKDDEAEFEGGFHEEAFARFEVLGEDAVKAASLNGRIAEGDREAADSWLKQLADRRSEIQSRRALRIEISTYISAIAAIVAALAATIAAIR